jgi:hypothetical protein
MGRKNKAAIVSTFARGPAERELWADLDSVLRIANGERGNPFCVKPCPRSLNSDGLDGTQNC